MAQSILASGCKRISGPSLRVDIVADAAIAAGDLVALSSTGGLVGLAEHAIAAGASGSIECAGVVRISTLTMGTPAPTVGLGGQIDTGAMVEVDVPAQAHGVVVKKSGSVVDLLLNQAFTTPF